MKKYNILWLFSDQHRASAMSMNGDVNVCTPNLDALAADGISFDRSYSVSPLCSPFRASLYTGKHICQHGVGSLHIPPKRELPMVPELLQQEGYHTVHFGKWHLSGGACPSHFVSAYFRPGWDEWYGWENSNKPFNTTFSVGKHPKVHTLPGYQTDSVTDMVLEWLDNYEEDKPWFLVWSVEPPHDPHVAPEKYMESYRERPIVFRDNVPAENRDENTENTLRGYYAQICNLDDNIGRIIGKLRETGQYDNTVIMYFSDHGDFHGSHGRYEKVYAENESSQIPFIVRVPEMNKRGVRSEALVSSLDIPVTSLALCGLTAPDFDGMDLSPIVTEGEGEANEQIIIGTDNKFLLPTDEYLYRALMTKRYLYVKAARKNFCALYDMENDLYQIDNLLGQEKYEQTAEQMDKALREKLESIGDDFYTRVKI